MTLAAITLILLTAAPTHCDEIQLNHFDCYQTQWIVIDSYEANGVTTYHATDWAWQGEGTLLKRGEEFWLVMHGRVYVSECFAETASERDPEVADRELLDPSLRQPGARSCLFDLCGVGK